MRCDDRPKILKSRFRVMNMAKKRMLATITGSHHPGSFHAGLLFHWPLSANVVFAMMCRVRRLGMLVDNAAQGGPTVVAIVGSILSPGTRGGLSSDTKYVDNTLALGQVKE